MRPKLSLEELVCVQGLTLKAGEKYDEIISIEINRMFGGSSIILLTAEMDGLSRRGSRQR